jgi:hypothetical protein
MESEVRISHENELASNPEPPSSNGETVRTDNSESVRKKYSHLIKKLENVPKGKYMPKVNYTYIGIIISCINQ